MADEYGDYGDESGLGTLPRIRRDIAANPIIPSAPADAEPAKANLVDIPEPGDLLTPPKEPKPRSVSRGGTGGIIGAGGVHYSPQETMPYTDPNAAPPATGAAAIPQGVDPDRWQHYQDALQRYNLRMAHAAVGPERQGENADVSEALRQNRVATMRDEQGNLVPYRDEQGNVVYKTGKGPVSYDEQGQAVQTQWKPTGPQQVNPDAEAAIGTHPDYPNQLFKQNAYSPWEGLGTVQQGLQSTDPNVKSAAQLAQLSLDKRLHSDVSASLGNDFVTKVQDMRGKAATLANLQSQLDKITPEQLNAKTSRFFGSPTTEAQSAQAKKADLEKQITDLQEKGYSPTVNLKSGQETPVGKSLDQTREALKDWQKAPPREQGDLDRIIQQRQVALSEQGIDPATDPVFKALEARKQQLGITQPAQPDDQLRKDPLYAPLMGERDALDEQHKAVSDALNDTAGRLQPARQEIEANQAQIAPLEKIGGALMTRLESLLGMQQAQPGEDLDVRNQETSSRLSQLTDVRDKARAQTLLNRLEPILNEVRQRKAELQPLIDAHDAMADERNAVVQQQFEDNEAQLAPQRDALQQKFAAADEQKQVEAAPDMAQQIEKATQRALAEQKIGEDWESGNIPKGLYHVDPAQKGITFERGYTAPAIISAMRDGAISPDWAREHLDDARKADDDYRSLMEAAGSNPKLKAFIDTGIKSYISFQGGAAASAAVAPFDPELAAAGAAVTAPVGGWGAVALPALVHGITFLAGTAITSAVANKLLDKASQYSDLAKSLESSAQLEPGYAELGSVAGMGPAAVSSFAGFSKAAGMIAERDGTTAAVKFIATKLASGAGAGVVFEGALRPGFDTAIHALGLNPDEVHYPTFKSVAEAAAIMSILSGEGLGDTFKRAANLASTAGPDTAARVEEWKEYAKKQGVSPEAMSFFGGVDPEIAGTTPEKVQAFAKSLGMEWRPVPKPEEGAPAAEAAAAPTTEAAPEQPAERPTVEAAHDEIDNLQMEGKSPEEHAVTQDALRGLVKISQGEPMDALTSSEKKAVLSKDDNGIARVEMAKGPDGTKPVITDATLDRVREVAPTTAQILPQNEETQRQQILSGEKPTETEAAKPEEGQPTFAVEVENAKGERTVQEIQAADEDAARKQVAETIEPGQGLIRDVTELPAEQPVAQPATEATTPEMAAPTAPTPEERAAVPANLGNTPAEVEKTLGDQAVSTLSQRAGRDLTADEEQSVRERITPFAEPVHRWQNIFNEINVSPQAEGSMGAALDVGTRGLKLSLPDIIQHSTELEAPQGPEAAVRHEAIHAAAIQLSNEGKIDPVGLYNQMPDDVKEWVSGVYQPDQKERDPFTDGHEFLRLMVEEKLSLDGDKLLDDTGRVVTENLAPTFIQRVRDSLVKLVNFFRNIGDNLRGKGASEDLIDETIKTRDLVIDRLREVDATRRGAYLEKVEGAKATEIPTERSVAGETPTETEPIGGEGPRGGLAEPAETGKGEEISPERAGQGENVPEGATGAVQPGGGEKLTPEQEAKEIRDATKAVAKLQVKTPLTRIREAVDAAREQDIPISAEQLVNHVLRGKFDQPEEGQPPEPLPTATAIANTTEHPVQEVPVSELKLSQDVPNFKEEASKTTGVVEGQQLQGQYNRLGTGAVTVWERANGDKEVISGRHRFELAQRSGEATIPTQIVREADGFTKTDAITFDAEANIRDGQGTVGDYANYFRNSDITPEEASSRGLLARDKGRKGYALGQYASDDLYALYRSGKISESKAASIADGAQGNDDLQNVGIRAAQSGASLEEIKGQMEAAQNAAEVNPSEKADQSDFFSNTELGDTWKKQGKYVAEQRKSLQDIISTRKAIVNKYDAATSTGSIQAKREEAQTELATAQTSLDRWKEWAKHPDLKAQVEGQGATLVSQSLIEFAKSKLPESVAGKITTEKQVESFRPQWEKEQAAIARNRTFPAYTTEQLREMATRVGPEMRAKLEAEISARESGVSKVRVTPQVTPSTKAIQTSQPTQLELLRAQELNVHPDEITKQSKIWQKLYALEQEGQGLTPDQRAAMDNAEKILGQRFLFSAKETEAAPSGALTKVKPKFSGPTQGGEVQSQEGLFDQRGAVGRMPEGEQQGTLFSQKTQGGEQNASSITSTKGGAEREVRTRVGEATPLRQQGNEIAGVGEAQRTAAQQALSVLRSQPLNKAGEKIKYAAIKLPNGEVVESTGSHADAAEKAYGESWELFYGNKNIEGFTTTKGRFLGREEAFTLAKSYLPKLRSAAPWRNTHEELDSAPLRDAISTLRSQPLDRFNEGLPLATQIAHRYSNLHGVEREDIEQHARIALSRAAEAFEPSKGAFRPFAKAAINNELRDLYTAENRQKRGAETVSLEEPINEAGDLTRKDLVRARNDVRAEVARDEGHRILNETLAELPDRMQGAINGILSGRLLKDIGTDMGVSKQAVGKLATEAMRRLRAKLGERGIARTSDLLSQQVAIIDAHLQDTLKAQAATDPLQQLIDSLDTDRLEKLFDKANAEERGKYTIGRPDLAMGAGEASQRAVDQYYTDLWKPKTRDKMQREADKILSGSHDFANEIAQRWLDGDTLRDSEVMAAKATLADLSRDMSPAGLSKMFATGFAYRNIRGQTARDLAAGFDPHKTPEERNREFLAKVISTLPPDKEAEISREVDPVRKRALLDNSMKERLDQLEKAFSYLSKGGLTLQDVMSGAWELHGKGKEFLENQINKWDVPRQKAIKLAQTGTRTAKEIAKATGLSAKDVSDAIDLFNDNIEKELTAKVSAGLTYNKMNFEGALLAQPTGERTGKSPEEIKAEVRKIMRGMGYGVAGKDLGNFKVVSRKRPKIFVPPKVARAESAEDIARREGAPIPYPEDQKAPYTGRVLGQPGLPLYQEMMVRKGADLGSVDDVARIARVAQAANGNKADMIFEAWLASILSGPSTHIAYKMALAANSGFEFGIQRGVESLVNLAYRDKDAPSFGEFKYVLKGLLPGVVKGISLGARQWSTESELFNHEVLNSQIEAFPEMPATGYQRQSSISETPVQQFFGKGAAPIDTALSKLGKFNPVRGRVVRMPFRALYFIDGFYKATNAQMGVGGYAYRMARREGLEGDALSRRVNELVATPGSPAWVKAVDVANWLTFRERIPTTAEGGNWIDNAVSAIAKARNKSHLIGSQIPFIQLPYNIVKVGFGKAFSPATTAYKFAKAGAQALPRLGYDPDEGAFKMKDGKPFTDSYAKADQIRDVATSLIALGTMAMIWEMVAGDGNDDDKKVLITGSTPYTQLKKGVRELQQRAYGGPYVLRIGGRNGVHINFGKYEPGATVLGTLADTIIQMKHIVRGESSVHESMDALAGYFIAQAQEKTFLRGFDNISRVMSGEMGATEFAANLVMQGLVPALIRQPLRNLDDYIPDYKHSSSLYRLLPGAGLREPKIDIWGEPVAKTGNKFTRMFTIPTAKPYAKLEPADALLLRWNNEHPREIRGPSPPQATYTDPQDHRKTIQMSDPEATKFQIAVGHQFNQLLRGRITTHQIEHPTEKDIEMIEEAHKRATKETKARMFPKGHVHVPVNTVNRVNLIKQWKQAA